MRQIVNQNVCVIGGAGFLGSHLVDYLVEERGCTVLVLDNLITGVVSYVNPKAKFEWFDIRGDENELAKFLKRIILNMYLTMLPSHIFLNALNVLCTFLTLTLHQY